MVSEGRYQIVADRQAPSSSHVGGVGVPPEVMPERSSEQIGSCGVSVDGAGRDLANEGLSPQWP